MPYWCVFCFAPLRTELRAKISVLLAIVARQVRKTLRTCVEAS